MTHRFKTIGVVCLAAVAACGGPDSSSTTDAVLDTTTSSPPGSTTITASTNPSVTTTPEETQQWKAQIVLTDVAPSEWIEHLLLPYGVNPEELGDGLAINEQFGPELPVARDRQGNWWVADTYKQRVAVFDDAGSLIAEYRGQPRSPIHGLQVLDDGRAIGASTDGRAVLIDEHIEYFDVGTNLTLLDTDGSAAFGSVVGAARLAAVRVVEGGLEAHTVRGFGTRAGTSYVASVTNDPMIVTVIIDVGARSTTHTLEVADAAGGDVFAVVEAVAGPDGSVHLLLVGWSESDESRQLGRYVHVSADGLLTDVSIPNPFGALDPATPSHLVVDPATGEPYIAVIDSDGVRIWSLGEG